MACHTESFRPCAKYFSTKGFMAMEPLMTCTWIRRSFGSDKSPVMIVLRKW